jgi:hypothetical protein
MNATVTPLFIPEPPAPEGLVLPSAFHALSIADSFWKQHPYPAIAQLKARILLRTNFDGGIPAHMPDLGHCWLWEGGARDGKGRYAGIYFNGKTRLGHRLAWMMWRGNIPGELTVDHKCRTTFCVNPHHLQLLTREANTVADHGRGDRPGARTECAKGHSYDEENTYIEPKTRWRQCVTCRAANKKRYRAEAKAERLAEERPVSLPQAA